MYISLVVIILYPVCNQHLIGSEIALYYVLMSAILFK